MKTNLLLVLLTLNTLSLNTFAGERKPIPSVPAPRELIEINSEFAEGTITRLSAEDVAQFLPWAENSQKILTRALLDIESMPIDLQVKHLRDVMNSVVRRSGKKNYQMFMRFALNRGMLLVKELFMEADQLERGVLENALDIQVKAIKVALEVFESDLSYQRRVAAGEITTTLRYAKFGIRFAKAMFPAINSTLDASAQYRLLYKTLEMLNWDLSRDANANNYADNIIEIYNTLSVMNEIPTKDDRASLSGIRRLNVIKQSISSSEENAFEVSAGNSTGARALRAGESVIVGSAYFTVLGIDPNGRYAIQSTNVYRDITSSVPRETISIVDTCSNNLCPNESVIHGSAYYTVAGLSVYGRFTIKSTNVYKDLTPNIPRSGLGKTSGCLSGNESNFCVGAAVVMDQSRYTIAAIFEDGSVAIKATNVYKDITSNVRPSSLTLLGSM